MNDNFLWIIIGIMLLSSILTGIQQLRNDSKRTIKILGEIAKQIGVPETSVDDEIKNLVVEGKKIKAIKMYRQATGLGMLLGIGTGGIIDKNKKDSYYSFYYLHNFWRCDK